MIRALVLILLLGILVMGFPSACQYMEEPHRYYAQHSEALYAGNWVPQIFPGDIRNIHEQHDIDTNEVWVKFERGEKPIRTAHLTKLSENQVASIQFSKPFLTTWWFEGLIEQQSANDGALNANLYRGQCGPSRISYLAISKVNKEVYWWCQYE